MRGQGRRPMKHQRIVAARDQRRARAHDGPAQQMAGHVAGVQPQSKPMKPPRGEPRPDQARREDQRQIEIEDVIRRRSPSASARSRPCRSRTRAARRVGRPLRPPGLRRARATNADRRSRVAAPATARARRTPLSRPVRSRPDRSDASAGWVPASPKPDPTRTRAGGRHARVLGSGRGASAASQPRAAGANGRSACLSAVRPGTAPP